MSDNWIVVIPEDPHFVPDEALQERAVAYLRSIAPKADEVAVRVLDGVQFVDCGSSFESVACPACGKEMAIGAWQDWMDEDYGGNGIALKARVMPCCGVSLTLHNLKYNCAQGFRRFELSAMNPGIGELSDEQREQFEHMLGCSVRLIYRHI